MPAPRADAGWSEQVLHQGWGPGAERRAAARRDPPGIDDDSSYDDPDEWAPRRSPGTGFVLGLLGILAFVLSATVLPWIDTDAGSPVTLPDIRTAFDDRSISVVDARGDLSPSTTPGFASLDEAAADTGIPTDETAAAPGEEPAAGMGILADGTTTDSPADGTTALTDGTTVGVPAGGTTTVADGEDGAPTTGASTAQADVDRLHAAWATMTEDGRHDLIRWYSRPMWFVSLVLATLAVAFATALVPVGRGRRVLAGVVVAGPVGLLANLADRRGAVGPRLSGLVAASAALAMHVAAVRDLDAVSGASEAALGPVVGAGALAVVALACLIGTRAERPLPDG
jgi:hypothetical protein